MEIDEPVSKQTVRGGWRIQFNAGEDRIQFVEFVTFLLDEGPEAEHVGEEDERRLERLRHLTPRVLCLRHSQNLSVHRRFVRLTLYGWLAVINAPTPGTVHDV
jgi:hypothetical protein